MKATRYKAGLCLFLIMLFFTLSACGAAPVFSGSKNNIPANPNSYTEEELAKPFDYVDFDGYLKPGFSTHLPVIMIEYLADGTATAENDWYNSMEVSVFDGQKKNSPENEPAAVIPTEGRVIISSSMDKRLKQDYFLRLFDDNENPAQHSLLGLSPGSEFFLVGSMYDRSLIRNYLGYTLAGQIMEGIPNVRFCEVVQNLGSKGYLYQGVYLLIEKADMPQTQAFRRTTVEQGFGLETYGSQNYPEDGKMEIPFFDRIDDENALWEMVGKLSHVEEVIYSDDLDTFSGYKNLIDIDSFIDYFIINELLCNYSAKEDSFYRYNEASGLLEAGPVWDFERALDNGLDSFLDVDALQFENGGYYGRLIKSRAFLDRLKERYLELRVNVLNENSFNLLIDEAVDYLGPAIERDWVRWEYHIANNEEIRLSPMEITATGHDGQEKAFSFVREPQNSHWEIQRIRYLIREHDLQMAYNIAFLDADIGTELIGAEASYVRNTWLFILFIAVLAITIHYVRRYAE